MTKTWIVAKNELFRYFTSPLAYVYLVAFLLLNSSFAFYFGHFFDRGNAELSSMFAYQPWIYLIFISGISMRLWAEEFRHKTIIQIMTMPVSAAALVWGKFFASWIFCATALALTFPFWITVNLLGTPDNGVIALSYVGSLLLAGCMLAISQTMSALTKNQVIALVLSVIANLLFFLSGIEYVLAFFRAVAPLPIVDMVASFSFLTHFDTISQGLLELRDPVFFASLILLFNFTTVLIVSFRTSGTSPWLKSEHPGYYTVVFLLLLIGFVGLNLLANNLLRRWQFDFTSDRSFTISDTTRNLLQNLPEPVTAKLYYSPVLGERNPAIRLMADKLRMLLSRYQLISEGRFNYRLYQPRLFDSIEDRAIAAGLQPIPLIDLNQNAYFGLTLSDEADNHQIIPLFPLERAGYLEQDLTQKIYQLNRRKTTLGLITSLPLLETTNTEAGNMITPEWEIIRQIKQLYELKEIKQPQDFTDIDILMLVHPRGLSPELISKIETYTHNGGNSLVLLDPAAEAPRIFSPVNDYLYPSELNTLEDLWHFRYYPQAVVADLDYSITVDATTDYKNNPNFVQDIIQFAPKGASLNRSLPETMKLNSILFASASILRPLDDSVEFIPLIEASANSALMPADTVRRGINPADLLHKFKADRQEKVIAAKIIDKVSATPFTVIAVADSDFIYDSFWTSARKVYDTQYTVPLLDNGNFILNALESLSRNDGLIRLRGNTDRNRRFEGIERLRRQNQLEFKLKEAAVIEKINQTKNKLDEIRNKRSFEERSDFSADELAVISSYRRQLDELRTELAAIRIQLNQNIKQLKQRAEFFNIYLLPLLIVLSLGSAALWRRRKIERSDSFRINRPLIILLLSAAALLGLGIFSVKITNHSKISDYEGKLILPQLPEQINNIDSIQFKAQTGKLSFKRINDNWQLVGHEDLPVYQERIRRFLSSLLDARYYEKKSARAEYLERFGLRPLDVPGSTALNITLKEGDTILTRFDIGTYDIPVGRGARGAFIRFPGQFQVWLILADLIDLSPDWREWTYSSLWNLRFGRLQMADGISSPDQLTLLVKELLSTPLLSSSAELKDARPERTLNLLTEDNDKIRIDFFRSGAQFFVQYHFDPTINAKHLQFFADHAKGRFYEIPASAMEKLNDIFTAAESGTD